MTGFLTTNFYVTNKQLLDEEKLLLDGYTIQRGIPKKLCEDKIFKYDEQIVLITEGVVLNKRKIIEKWGGGTFYEAIKKAWNCSSGLMDIMYPGWSVALLDRDKNEWYFATNQIGDKPIFYYTDEDGKFIVSSDLRLIKQVLDDQHIKTDVCKNSVYDLLTFGYNVVDYGKNTLISGVKRLPAGFELRIGSDGKEKLNQYHRFKKDINKDLREDEVIELMDKLFVDAVRLQFDKDDEYGYRHLCALSGGLDSRMTVWVAHNLGYKNIVLETFCQTNTDDQKIAQQIVRDLKLEWIYKSLDDAGFISDIPEEMGAVNGLCEVSGTIHEGSLLKRINTTSFGIFHTGMLGDVIFGSFEPKHPGNFTSKAYSTLLFDTYNPQLDIKNYDDEEMFYFYTRGFLGAMCPQISQSAYVEPVSPFTSLPLMEFMFSVPPSLRRNHYIYKKWILTKYPEAARYIWEKTHSKITLNNKRDYLMAVKRLGVKNIILLLLRKTGIEIKITQRASSNNMNPYDYWYETNKKVRDLIQKLYSEVIDSLSVDSEIKRDIARLFGEGQCREKIQALSVLYGIRQFCNKG